MENEFDKIMRERLSEASSPPADLWDKIEGKLDAFENPIEAEKSIEISRIWKYAAAAVVSGIAVALGFMFVNGGNNQDVLIGGKTQLPVNLKEIQIGEKLIPSVQLVSVSDAKQSIPLEEKSSKKAVKSVAKQSTVDEQLVATNDIEIGNEEVNNIPVFSLKLNNHKTSQGMNDKIRVLSGEPKRVEVDADLNQKQILIQQRLRLINERKEISNKSRDVNQ